MAITAAPYAKFLLGMPQGRFNLLGSTPVIAALAPGSYTPDMTADEFLSDVEGLITGPGMFQTLTNISFTYDASSFTVVGAADQVVWSAANLSAQYAILALYTGTLTTSRLIGYINFGAQRTYIDEDFTLMFTNGFLTVPAVS